MADHRTFVTCAKACWFCPRGELKGGVECNFLPQGNGIKWRALPCDFPAWQTVYGYYRLWVRLGVWEQINTVLVQQVRSSVGREAQPSLAIIDSQSVKLGQKGGRNTGLMATSS